MYNYKEWIKYEDCGVGKEYKEYEGITKCTRQMERSEVNAN
jgi:hypothetical protein